MSMWSTHVLPRLIDRTCGTAEVRPYRETACAGLTGRVVELGFGSGLNCDLYPDEVAAVVAIEPSDLAWRLSAPRRAATTRPVTRGGLDGRRLPYDEDSFDAVLTTFALCTIADLGAALAEARRVLRPGGRLHFAEHGLAPDAGVARWQRRLDPLQGRLGGGCQLSRDIPGLLTAAGFEVDLARHEYAAGPRLIRPWDYICAGTATRA